MLWNGLLAVCSVVLVFYFCCCGLLMFFNLLLFLCYFSCSLMLTFFSHASRCSVDLAGDWLVCRLAASLVPGVTLLCWGGDRFLQSPPRSLFVWIKPTGSRWSTQPILVRVTWLSAPDWGERRNRTRFTFNLLVTPGPAHAPLTPWCCHNGNEMSCKLSLHLSKHVAATCQTEVQ